MATKKRPKGLPDYKQPPIDEVAIAVQFKELSKFTSMYQGYLFEAFRKKFPNYEFHPSVNPRFETFGKSIQKTALSFQVLNTPPEVRLWFISEDNHRLIQFQPNRLISNWRKVSGEGDYPHFEKILPEFFDHLKTVKDFLSKKNIGGIEINQCEVSYFNIIEKFDEESFVDTFSRVFKYWTPSFDIDLGKSVKLEGESCQFSIASKFFLGEIDEPVGRLHIQAAPATKSDTGEEVIKLTLVVRGRPMATDKRGLEKFFFAGREAIVKTFDAITTAECHDLWKRKP